MSVAKKAASKKAVVGKPNALHDKLVKLFSAVMEIACGSIPLIDDTKKCSDERTAGSELEIIVNPTTQKVQISVIKNSGKYFSNSITILETVRWSM